eukprot:678356-Pelagomonas_calceolata.AAC.2
MGGTGKQAGKSLQQQQQQGQDAHPTANWAGAFGSDASLRRSVHSVLQQQFRPKVCVCVCVRVCVVLANCSPQVTNAAAAKYTGSVTTNGRLQVFPSPSCDHVPAVAAAAELPRRPASCTARAAAAELPWRPACCTDLCALSSLCKSSSSCGRAAKSVGYQGGAFTRCFIVVSFFESLACGVCLSGLAIKGEPQLGWCSKKRSDDINNQQQKQLQEARSCMSAWDGALGLLGRLFMSLQLHAELPTCPSKSGPTSEAIPNARGNLDQTLGPAFLTLVVLHRFPAKKEHERPQRPGNLRYSRVCTYACTVASHGAMCTQ